MSALLELLPRGGTLPEDAWARRHRGILVLLWAHVAFIPVYAVIQGQPVSHALLEALLVAIPAAVATAPAGSRRARGLAAALGLLSSSAVLIHLSGGLIELHFHFFVTVVVISLYQDWLPFLAAVTYVFVHHGVFGVIEPTSVYNHAAAQANPWKWAGVHSLFIAGISLASLVNWRLNESHLVQRRRAEARLREESRIVERLDEVGRMLASDLELDQVVQRVTDVATEVTSAEFGAFFYNCSDESGNSYMLYTLSGVPREAFAGFSMPRATGMFGPTFAGEGVIRLDDVLADPRYGQNPPYHGMPSGHLPVRSYLAVPVVSRGAVLGGLFFGHSQPARFTESEERLAAGIAAHAAVAVENAQLYAAERDAREEAEAARRRLSIVAEAGRRFLSSALELEAVLEELASLVVPQVADICWIDLFEQGVLYRAGSAEPPEGQPPEVDRQATLSRMSPLLTEVLRTGRSQLVEPGGGLLAELGLDTTASSAALVPLPGRDGILGVLTLLTVAGSSRRLHLDDVHLAEDLGRRAAAAMENARLFANQRAAAETLQHSLLPENLPHIPGVEMAARYLPGGAGVDVGGDWYDVLALPDGTVGLAMGDVVGRGLPAASLMGRLRNALRAYAMEGHRPAEVLRRLNGLLETEERPDHLATLLYAVFDSGSGALRMANAGHPPPVLRTADGSVSLLDGGSGVPLGAIPGTDYEETTWRLEPGSTLVLYTDGLVEARDVHLDEGLRDLCASVAAGGDVEPLCEHILAGSAAQQRSCDDTALLLVRYSALGDAFSCSLPTQPAALRSLRGVLRRWLREGGATDDEVFDILVATGEACSNAIRHASVSGVTTFEVEAHRGDEVRVTVRDRGRWRAPRPNGDGGRGIAIMDELMDGVEILRGPPETIVSFRRALSGRVPAPL